MSETGEPTIAADIRPNELTFDEAHEAAVLGYRVTCDLLPSGSYIHYEFNGLRHEFSHNGRIGSSSSWTAGDDHRAATWRVFELKEQKRDSWGRPIK